MEDKNNIQNQNNTVNQAESKSNVNNALVIIIIVLVILLGISGYFLFMKNGNDKTPEQPTPPPTIPTNESTQSQEQEENKEQTQTPTQQNEESTNKLAANTIYKSRDGKSSLTVNSIESKKDGDISWEVAHISYNGKKYTFEVYDEDYKYGQYLTLDGDPDSGAGGQCHSAAVVLNIKNKTIEKFGTTGMPYYGVINGNDGYFFTEGYCLSGYDTIVYDNNWKKLGQLVGDEADNQGNIYAFDNGKIIKYNSDGSKVSEKSTSAKYTGPGVLYNNTLYYMGEENSGVYLYSNDTNEKYKLHDQSIDFKEGRYPYSGLDVEAFMNLTLENNKIMINYDSDEYGYSFDINTKQLTKLK